LISIKKIDQAYTNPTIPSKRAGPEHARTPPISLTVPDDKENSF
jgi:hypothetical protein